MSTNLGVFPLSAVKPVIGRAFAVDANAQEGAEGIERIEAAVLRTRTLNNGIGRRGFAGLSWSKSFTVPCFVSYCPHLSGVTCRFGMVPGRPFPFVNAPKGGFQAANLKLRCHTISNLPITHWVYFPNPNSGRRMALVPLEVLSLALDARPHDDRTAIRASDRPAGNRRPFRPVTQKTRKDATVGVP